MFKIIDLDRGWSFCNKLIMKQKKLLGSKIELYLFKFEVKVIIFFTYTAFNIEDLY